MSSSPSTSPTSRRRWRSTPALRDRAAQAPPGLRELRDRRAAAQAGPDRGAGRPRGTARPARSTTSASRSTTSEESTAARDRLPRRAWRPSTRHDTTCCYALQDKVWVHDPAGAPWEVYTVKDDNPAGDARPATACLDLIEAGGSNDGACCTPAAGSPPRTRPREPTAAAADRTRSRARLAAELLGTGLLVAAVVGSGIMAERLTDDVAVALLVNALATVAALGVLICTLGPVSGAHFNPAVTAVAAVRREIAAARGRRLRRRRRSSARSPASRWPT